jgi:pimeloyl-ACP methyl ester carboxylesterase
MSACPTSPDASLARPPDRFANLAFLDPATRADTSEQTERRLRLIALAQGGRFAEVPDALFPILVHRNRHGDANLKNVNRAMAADTGPEAFVRQQRAIMSRSDLRPSLAAIRCPTLVLVGDGDELTPPALAQEIAAGISGARLVMVPDSGHLSTLEQPEAVTKALVGWMEA